MKRRELLFGAATVAAGAGLLTGSEAFSRGVSHRQVRVEVAGDGDAYLKLEELERVTVSGTECETRGDLLSITNQSKLVLESFRVEIELDDADAFTITDVSVPGRLEVGETGAVTVTVEGSGQEAATGTVVVTAETVGDNPGGVHGPEGRFELHRSWQLTLEADCQPDREGPSFLALCGATDVDGEDVRIVYDDEGVWKRVEWNSSVDPETVVLYSGTGTDGFDKTEGKQSFLNYDIGERTSAVRGKEDQEAGRKPPGGAESTGQTPSCPCRNNSGMVPETDAGVKFDVDDDGTVSGNGDSVCNGS